jgi:signal transduction histidine kinase
VTTAKQETEEKSGHRKVMRATVIRAIVAVVLLALVITGGLIITNRIADFQRDQYYEARKYQAAAAASLIDPNDVRQLLGAESDLGNPAYGKLQEQLAAVKKSDGRIRYAYLMRPDGKTPSHMIFLVDAENRDSSEYSPPGQVYYEAKPADFKPFNGTAGTKPTVEGHVSDRWGQWISATAYIVDGSGHPVAALGTDVDVRSALTSFNQIRYVGTIATVLTALLLLGLLLVWMIWRYNRDEREELRAEMEESMLQLNEELLETDAMKSEFIEAASHELRGPVTAVDAALQVLEAHMPEPSEGKDEFGRQSHELIRIARSGSARLVELINDLLDVTRIEAGGLNVDAKPFDLRLLTSTTAELFRVPAREKGLTLDVADEGVPVMVRADEKAVRRVLENLVGNAVKYTDEGSIKIELKVIETNARVSVEDTGRGIPERMLEETFKKFSKLHLSTDSRERGAGLGLSISKGLIEANGGTISVASEEGKGSTFVFELPLIER